MMIKITIMFESEVYLIKHCLVSVYNMDNDDYNNNVWKWSIPDETLFNLHPLMRRGCCEQVNGFIGTQFRVHTEQSVSTLLNRVYKIVTNCP